MISARMTETRVSRRFRLSIFPVAARSAELCLRSCQARTRMASQPLERATSQARAKSPAMTRMLPNGG